MKLNTNNYTLTENGNFGARALWVGIIGIILSLLGLFLDANHFFHSYLTAVFFWLSIGVGGLFFTMLHHLVTAKWSVVLRRMSEKFMSAVPIMAILFIPVFFGIQYLYHWSHPDAIAADAVLQHKSPYLNTTFFIIRSVLYFAIWILFGRALLKRSLQQDTAHEDSLFAKMKKLSAIGMVLFAFTISFAGFDWFMSLDAKWYSTIFGVYIFSGSLLAILAAITLLALGLRKRGILNEEITVEHYHDLGKLMFGFTVFWAYIAFSQFMLIWYGNIPEETIFYKHRWEDPTWRVVSLIILFGHFVVPFLGLLTRAAKRNLTWLKYMAIWILIIHWIDIYWLVFPSFGHTVHFSWVDITATAGVGGIFLWFFWKRFVADAIIPIKDPYLNASVNFINQ